MRRPLLRRLLTWSGLLVSLAFIYLAFRGIHLRALGAALADSNYWMLGPALLILAFAIALRGIRWRLLFAPAHRPDTGSVMNAMLVGYLFNSVLPARAGEAARVFVLSQRAGTAKSEVLGTVIAERAVDVLCLLGLLFASASAVPEVAWLRRALVLGVALFVVLVIVLVASAVYGERPAKLILSPLRMLPRMSASRVELAACNLVRGLAVFRDGSIALAAFVLTASSWLLIAVASWLCMIGFHLGLGFTAGLLVVVGVNLAMILPSGPAGVGVFEAATLVALQPWHVDRSSALSYALVLHALNVVPLVLAGYIALHCHAVVLRRRGSSAPELGTPAHDPVASA